ncbi:hypothetical protein FQZ97_537850 [compost metagenome]
MHVAEQALLPAAETMPGHGHRDRHVDAHHAHLDAPAELAGDVTVTGIKAHAVAELVVIDELHGLGEILDAQARQHRTEDFLLVDAHVRGDVVEQRASQPEAIAAALACSFTVEAATIHQQRGAFLDALLDIAGDAFQRGAGDDRPHLGFEVGAVEHLESPGAFDQFRHDLLGSLVAHEDGHADSHAALAGRTVGGADQGVHHLVDIGVGHDHQVVLRAAQGLDALAVARAGLVDVIGDGRGADERDRLNVGMFEQRVDRLLGALHHVEHAIGESGLLEQLSDEQAGAGIDRAGLEHEGIAGRQGHREHPHRHHHREVEGRDARYHAQRLAQGPVVDVGADLVGEIGLEQLRRAAGEFDDLDSAGDFALGVGEHLAVLRGDQPGQFVAMLVEQGQEAIQDARAAQRRQVAPGRERGPGRGNGRVHIGVAGQLHLAGDDAGGRIVDRQLLAAGGLHGSAGNPVQDRMGHGVFSIVGSGTQAAHRPEN